MQQEKTMNAKPRTRINQQSLTRMRRIVSATPLRRKPEPRRYAHLIPACGGMTEMVAKVGELNLKNLKEGEQS